MTILYIDVCFHSVYFSVSSNSQEQNKSTRRETDAMLDTIQLFMNMLNRFEKKIIKG